MGTTLRRMFWVALLGGAGYAGWMAWQGRGGDETSPAPQWPPLDPPASDHIAASIPSVETPTTHEAPVAGFAELSVDDGHGGSGSNAPSAARSWVEPVDDACPDGYAIKANDNSGIFHVPGGRFYDRTIPERCYADAADAEADGYRRAKA